MEKLFKPNLLKSIRIKKEVTHEEMGTVIGKSEISYRKKENGFVAFAPEEIVAVAKRLHLTYEDVNEIFFGGQLPVNGSDLPYKTTLDV